jgi:hypothetical protein
MGDDAQSKFLTAHAFGFAGCRCVVVALLAMRSVASKTAADVIGSLSDDVLEVMITDKREGRTGDD